MPLTVKLKSTRITNDQHRVEVKVVDVPVEARLKIHSDENAPASSEGASPAPAASGSIAYDVRLGWETGSILESGFSHPPARVVEDAPIAGRKTVEWRGLGLGETRSFLVRRVRPGAYTVDLVAEVHLRVLADACGTTVTFPPTP